MPRTTTRRSMATDRDMASSLTFPQKNKALAAYLLGVLALAAVLQGLQNAGVLL